jgi:hypothetical protein
MDELRINFKRVDITFRFQPMASTAEGIVLDYLKSTEVANQLALQAMITYWLPYAYQECGIKKPSELKKVAQEMVRALESHILRLCIDFGIERNVSTSVSNFEASIVSKSVASSHKEYLNNDSDYEEFLDNNSSYEEFIDNDSGVLDALASAATFQFNTSGL